MNNNNIGDLKTAIIKLLKDNELIRHEIAELLSILPWSITKVINDLIKEGVVARTGRKKKSKFNGDCEILTLAANVPPSPQLPLF